jgi:hypothetical protein
MRSRKIWQHLWRDGRRGALLLLIALLSGPGARAQASPQELHLVGRVQLPTEHSVATDIRWAGDNSVYISWGRDGVFEVGLDGARRRTLVPDLKTLGNGINQYQFLALSPPTLAVASLNWGIVWRPLKVDPDGKIAVQSQQVPLVNSLDLAGDRVLLMGLAEYKRDKDGNPPQFAPRGDVAWIGSLSDGLKDLKPLLYDAGGAGAPNYFNCGTRLMGAVRFLAGGSFIIAPGFQDGIHLYDAAGREVRTWTNEQVGIDTQADCRNMSYGEQERFRSEAGWGPWLNRHHVLDAILPLPQEPGLLVRSWGSDGQAHWTLKVLQAEGIRTYAVPVVSRRPSDRLRGDVRDGRIVLLLASGFPRSQDPANFPSEMLVMGLPNDGGGKA